MKANNIKKNFQKLMLFIYYKGREKTPAYNLGAFYHPQGLLSLFKYETIRIKNVSDEYGVLENLVFQSEMTSRDKEHVNHKNIIFTSNLWHVCNEIN